MRAQGNATRVLNLLVNRPKASICKGRTPMQAIKDMEKRGLSPAEREQYVLDAKVDAVLTSCAKSLPQVRSGLLCYISFVDWVRPGTSSYLPPTVELLQAWSTAFRCPPSNKMCI